MPHSAAVVSPGKMLIPQYMLLLPGQKSLLYLQRLCFVHDVSSAGRLREVSVPVERCLSPSGGVWSSGRYLASWGGTWRHGEVSGFREVSVVPGRCRSSPGGVCMCQASAGGVCLQEVSSVASCRLQRCLSLTARRYFRQVML